MNHKYTATNDKFTFALLTLFTKTLWVSLSWQWRTFDVARLRRFWKENSKFYLCESVWAKLEINRIWQMITTQSQWANMGGQLVITEYKCDRQKLFPASSRQQLVVWWFLKLLSLQPLCSPDPCIHTMFSSQPASPLRCPRATFTMSSYQDVSDVRGNTSWWPQQTPK